MNYYGDGCTTFCRARDDQFGHYNCSSTGQKVCLEGWYGPDCDKAKCRPGCNQQHGYCEKPDTCLCRPGWTGSRCDECITYPGCLNGYCLSPWQCICQRNWGGVLCDQDLNFCGTHDPCKNNGTCQNVAPGKYKCSCPEGFAGVDCDIDLSQQVDLGPLTQLSAGCALNPCLNGGTCFGFKTQFGPSEVDFQNPEVQTNSTNESVERIYRCQCPPNWTGDYCQWADSSTLSITNILFDATLERTNTTEPSTTSTSSDFMLFESTKNETIDKVPPIFSTYIESPQQAPPHFDMKHIISWVVIASVIGVFLASLLLAWCCLLAIERNRFSFIQMNIIRNSDDEPPAVPSTLRRMHEKIRDSFRLPSRNRIKPETKLSIENVLRPPKPPPPYEENTLDFSVNKPQLSDNQTLYQKPVNTIDEDIVKSSTTNDNLVTGGVIEQKSASSSSVSPTSGSNISINLINDARLLCPRHGHLYRQRTMNEQVGSYSGAHQTGHRHKIKTGQQTYFHHQSNYHLDLH